MNSFKRIIIDKRKTIVIIIAVLCLLILGTTTAWRSWTSNNTDVTFSINDGITVTYEAGPDISNVVLIPVSSKEKGETDGTGVAKTITVSASEPLYMDLNLNLETFPVGLKDQSLRWEIYDSNTLVNSGNFGSVNQGDTIKLLNGYSISTTTKTFKLYIWIDLNQDNPLTMQNQHFKFVLNAETTDETPSRIASDYIISLSQGDTCNAGASGVYATNAYQVNGETKYHEYRYIGAEPDNYVLFNSDMYQIIGIFDKNSYDRESVENNDYGDYLIKLIAVNPLTAMSWGAYNTTNNSGTYSNYKNDWAGKITGVPASANIMLNQYFLNSDTLNTGYTNQTYGTCADWTYTYQSSSYKNRNCKTIVGYGIKSNISNYIQTVTWYLKGFDSTSYTRGEFYDCERGISNNSNCTAGYNGTSDSTTSAKIGLMYVSDYSYASGNFACGNGTSVNSDYMGNSNWLYKGYEWMITPTASSDSVAFHVFSSGVVSISNTYVGFGVRPSFYLKSNIEIKSGNGSFQNPYVLE